MGTHFEEHADVIALGQAEREQLPNHEHLDEMQHHNTTRVGTVHGRRLVRAHGRVLDLLLFFSSLRFIGNDTC